MSAIYGTFSPTGVRLDHGVMEVMLMAIAGSCGEVTTGQWTDGTVALGNLLLRTTEESLKEQMPRMTDGLVITADARIDNRAELQHQLAGGGEGSEADSDLILAAYRKWGTSCPEKLTGDFAFAIWDSRKQMLFCARDHVGMKPFYYHAGRDAFVFASRIGAVLMRPGVGRTLNEARVADYLLSEFDDVEMTFYRGIFRLPPGHSITVSRDRVDLRKYWRLDRRRESLMNSDDEYADAFLHVFEEAVRCRLRGSGRIGAHLSGGLDSSSIVCVAERLLPRSRGGGLAAFSAIFDSAPQSDERTYIRIAAEAARTEPYYVHPDRLSPLRDSGGRLIAGDEPLYFPNVFLQRSLYEEARQRGVHVLLSGHDGDTAVSYGYRRLTELAYAGDWARFAVEAQGSAATFNVPALNLLEKFGSAALIDLARRGRWVRLLHDASVISRRLPVSMRAVLFALVLKPAARNLRGRLPKRRQERLISEDFANRMKCREPNQSLAAPVMGPPRTERESHFRLLSDGIHPLTQEVLDVTAAEYGIETRQPFFDRRVLEFCLALPSEQKLSGGWTRVIMRRAMKGILPEAIRWRVQKSNLAYNFTNVLLKFERQLMDELIYPDTTPLTPYVNMPFLRRIYDRYVSAPNNEDAVTVWKAVSLGVWLQAKRLEP